jgi:hypothetical protein
MCHYLLTQERISRMTATRTSKMSAFGLCLAAVAAGVLSGAAPAAATVADTAPPSVPQNLHSTGLQGGNAVLSWDASTDDSGSIYHYWVLVDGAQRARPAAPTYRIDTLVNLGRITPGRHRITVQAVDRSLNRSAPSSPLDIVVT